MSALTNTEPTLSFQGAENRTELTGKLQVEIQFNTDL